MAKHTAFGAENKVRLPSVLLSILIAFMTMFPGGVSNAATISRSPREEYNGAVERSSSCSSLKDKAHPAAVSQINRNIHACLGFIILIRTASGKSQSCGAPGFMAHISNTPAFAASIYAVNWRQDRVNSQVILTGRGRGIPARVILRGL